MQQRRNARQNQSSDSCMRNRPKPVRIMPGHITLVKRANYDIALLARPIPYRDGRLVEMATNQVSDVVLGVARPQQTAGTLAARLARNLEAITTFFLFLFVIAQPLSIAASHIAYAGAAWRGFCGLRWCVGAF